jgi:hypothetical protein
MFSDGAKLFLLNSKTHAASEQWNSQRGGYLDATVPGALIWNAA